MKNRTAVILLSGGLDSTVSLACAKSDGIDVKLALTFDYGQKAFSKELNASKNIAEFYGIKHKVIELPWLKEITQTSLVADFDVPAVSCKELSDISVTKETMKNVWIPNRNGLFVNIAGAFCDSFEFDYVIIGANKEEASTFSDNSEDFIDNINKSFEFSTNYNVKTIAPLISMDKKQIIQRAVELSVPLELINSCYDILERHCGVCESCNRLKRALTEAGQLEILKILFK